MLDERQFYSINASDLTLGQSIFGPYDAGQRGVRWHRARCFDSSGNWKISFFAAEQPDAAYSFTVCYENPNDILLYAYKGRYLWVKIDADSAAAFERIRLYYPAHSFTRYLPGAYQTADLDSFFPRFLALFQSVFLDLDEKIAEFPALLDPAAAENTYLPMLAGWLGCEEFELLPERGENSQGNGQRAEFLLKCVEWYKGYGTRAVMNDVLEWLCGCKPFIVEYTDFEQFASQNKINQLFFRDMFIFTVLLPQRKYAFLSTAERLIEKMKPAYTVCNLVLLKDEIKLDEHAYLGFNSYI